MPFVALREIQLGRLHQFCRFIWKWNIPDSEHVAAIFNLTKRRAAGLISDFIARFRKVYLYPLIIRSLFRLLRESYDYNLSPERVMNVLGRRISIRELRFLDEMNALLAEPVVRSRIGAYRAWELPEETGVMFVPEDAIKKLLDRELGVEELLEKLYPLPDDED